MATTITFDSGKITRIILYPNYPDPKNEERFYPAKAIVHFDITSNGVTKRVQKEGFLGSSGEAKTLREQHQALANVGSSIQSLVKDAVLEGLNEDVSG